MARVGGDDAADLRRPADAAERRRAGTGLTLPLDEAGAGPAVLLLHAGIADRTMWSEHLEPLAAAGYRVIAPDLPGFGEAPVGPGLQAPWNDVLETMRELELDRAAIVGSSFGGAVALRVAVVAPAAVSSLALISVPAPGLKPSDQLEAAWDAEEAALADDDLDGAVDAVLAAWVPERLHPRVRPMQRRAFELQDEAGDVAEAPDPAETLDSLRRIQAPALIAAGELDMPDFLQGAEAIAEAIPGAQHAVIPGAGHLAPLETPEEFRSMLVEFLGAVRET